MWSPGYRGHLLTEIHVFQKIRHENHPAFLGRILNSGRWLQYLLDVSISSVLQVNVHAMPSWQSVCPTSIYRRRIGPVSSGIHLQDLPLILSPPGGRHGKKMVHSLYRWLASSPTHQPGFSRATIIFKKTGSCIHGEKKHFSPRLIAHPVYLEMAYGTLFFIFLKGHNLGFSTECFSVSSAKTTLDKNKRCSKSHVKPTNFLPFLMCHRLMVI
jgi:hypothetical protein